MAADNSPNVYTVALFHFLLFCVLWSSMADVNSSIFSGEETETQGVKGLNSGK